MPYILAATDFSDAADNALHYACKLAGAAHASLKLIHSFMIPVTFGENPMPVMPLDEGREIAEERMDSLVNELAATYPQLTVSGQVTFGDIIDCLQEIAEEEKPLMVVLGNDGAKDDLMWLGSNTVGAMRHVKVPVLGVPTGYSYRAVKKICYACDFKNNEDSALAEDLKHLATLAQAQLHILYIDRNSNESSEEQQLSMEGTPLHQSLASIDPIYHFVEKASIEEGVDNFIKENNMDWLVIVPHKHSFLESIFKKSHTKSLVKTTTIPLVALHEHRQ